MREAIGGTFMLNIMLIFLMMYIIFLAVCFNYVKAYRVKNGIIDFIEKYEGYNNLSKPKIDEFLDSMNYFVVGEDENGSYASSHPDAHCYRQGYCIEEVNDEGRIGMVITTFIPVNIFGLETSLKQIRLQDIRIKGEIQVFSSYWTNEF